MRKILHYFMICFLLFAAGCRKDELINKVVIDEQPPVVLTGGSFKGQVLDESGEPVADATVTVYKSKTTTDAKGRFELKNIPAPKDAALVKVEKEGYFTGSAMSGNSAGGQHYTRVTLLEKGTPQTVSATAGGTIEWANGLKMVVKPNTLKYAIGSAFAGTAQVSARWLDPSDPELGGIMPGALMARDEEGKEKVLASFGMAALELKTANGDELVLSDGATAELEIPIPAGMETAAPEEIPLWYFDLEQERWLLKGSCHKMSGGGHYYYGCSVTSGGYWNCDIALEPICLSGTVYQSDSSKALYTKVIVEDLTDNFIYWGYTDLNGFFCGSVPKGAPLKITVKDLCNNILYEANIGPYATDTNLGDIYLANTLSQYLVHFTGTLNDCNGNPVANGQIAVQYPGKIRVFPLAAPGVFDIQLALNCIDFPEFHITGYDLTAFKSTQEILYTDTSAIDLGALGACNDLSDYLLLSVDGVASVAAPTRFYLKNNVTTNWMVLEGVTTGGTFTLDLRQYNGAGVYNANAFFHLDNKPADPQYLQLNAASPDITVNVSSDDGQFISGAMTGTAYDDLNQPHAIQCDFRVKKEL